jgi:hypothetical protein
MLEPGTLTVHLAEKIFEAAASTRQINNVEGL